MYTYTHTYTCTHLYAHTPSHNFTFIHKEYIDHVQAFCWFTFTFLLNLAFNIRFAMHFTNILFFSIFLQSTRYLGARAGR